MNVEQQRYVPSNLAKRLEGEDVTGGNTSTEGITIASPMLSDSSNKKKISFDKAKLSSAIKKIKENREAGSALCVGKESVAAGAVAESNPSRSSNTAADVIPNEDPPPLEFDIPSGRGDRCERTTILKRSELQDMKNTSISL